MRMPDVFVSHRHSPLREICSSSRARSRVNHWEIHHCEQKFGVKGYFTKTLKHNIPHLFIKQLIWYSAVINALLVSECLPLVMDWHTLKEKMTMCLYGHFWSISINIFKQNEIAWLFTLCPLVCLSLQNYPQGWQIVNIMQCHSPGSRPVSAFCRHSPFLETFQVF